MAKSKKIAKVVTAAVLSATVFPFAACNNTSDANTDTNAQDNEITVNLEDLYASQQEQIEDLESRIYELEQNAAANTAAIETLQSITDVRETLRDIQNAIDSSEEIDGYAAINALNDLEYQIETIHIADFLTDEQAQDLTDSCTTLEKTVLCYVGSQGISKTVNSDEALIITGTSKGTNSGYDSTVTQAFVYDEAAGYMYDTVYDDQQIEEVSTIISNEKGSYDCRDFSGYSNEYNEFTTTEEGEHSTSTYAGYLSSKTIEDAFNQEMYQLVEQPDNEGISAEDIYCVKTDNGEVSYYFSLVYYGKKDTPEKYSFTIDENGNFISESYSYNGENGESRSTTNLKSASKEEAYTIISTATQRLDQVKQAQNNTTKTTSTRIK